MTGPLDDARPVRPDGLRIRRMRRERGWSRRDCVEAIARAAERASGLAESVSPDLLKHVEEAGEAVSYSTLCRIAAGFDCEPVEILRDPE